ncbi:MAG TPA: metallophosphoesterase [Trueperaceae bacterium]|nr:metallophosphoesterase [Trueperaceae bacterium]
MVGEGARGLTGRRAAEPSLAPANARILAIADAVSPVIYSSNFPGNLPPFDLILSAGDVPGDTLEFVATKASVTPLYVLGNHGDGFIRDPETDELRLPGGCVNVHLQLVEVNGVVVLGVEGSARYRDGPQQYSEREYAAMLGRLAPRLWLSQKRRGRAVDVLLTHAPPLGPNAGEDLPHRGVPAFNAFHRRWRPLVHVHGHVHLSGGNAPRSYRSPEGVAVINAYEFTLIDLPDDSTRSVGGR